MRTLILASALLLVALVVILAVGSGNKRDSANTSQPSQPMETAEQAQAQQTPSDGVRRVTVEELRAALDKGTAIVVDVRGTDAYKAGHIKGAVSIPENEIANRTKELPKDKLIVTYCS
ncbi:MAG: hypothetical protein ICV60_07865 [Pyrinomonadaceae bacterium]|nr:hypothetical protein [Pyrinomonadaceae bacterium]